MFAYITKVKISLKPTQAMDQSKMVKMTRLKQSVFLLRSQSHKIVT